MEHTVHYRLADGSISETVYTLPEGVGVPPPPEGAEVIDADTYAAELAQVQARVQAQRALLLDNDRRQRVEDYQALRAAGIPEATARRLTGYTPDDETGGP